LKQVTKGGTKAGPIKAPRKRRSPGIPLGIHVSKRGELYPEKTKKRKIHEPAQVGRMKGGIRMLGSTSHTTTGKVKGWTKRKKIPRDLSRPESARQWGWWVVAPALRASKL